MVLSRDRARHEGNTVTDGTTGRPVRYNALVRGVLRSPPLAPEHPWDSGYPLGLGLLEKLHRWNLLGRARMVGLRGRAVPLLLELLQRLRDLPEERRPLADSSLAEEPVQRAISRLYAAQQLLSPCRAFPKLDSAIFVTPHPAIAGVHARVPGLEKAAVFMIEARLRDRAAGLEVGHQLAALWAQWCSDPRQEASTRPAACVHVNAATLG